MSIYTIFMWKCICKHTYVCTYIYIHTHTQMCILIYIYIYYIKEYCICMNIHLYIHIDVYVFYYWYVNIWIERERSRSRGGRRKGEVGREFVRYFAYIRQFSYGRQLISCNSHQKHNQTLLSLSTMRIGDTSWRGWKENMGNGGQGGDERCRMTRPSFVLPSSEGEIQVCCKRERLFRSR